MFWFKKKEKKIENKKQELAKIEDKKQIAAEAIVGMDIALYAPKAKVNLTEYQAFPISKIGAMGMAFSPVMEALQSISAQQTGETLYRAILPQGTHLAIAKNGSGLLGTAIRDGQGIVGQAKFQQVVTSPSIPTIKPAMIYAAVVLMEVDKKLDAIQEGQREILGFLVQKEKSELRGDLKFLNDILNKYKFSWDNENYKNTYRIKVLDVKQETDRKIDFYRNQIIAKMDKKKLLHKDKDSKKKLEEIYADFGEYQLAVYVYAYASFLETLLLDNFSKGHLDNIKKEIESYSLQYRTLYTECYDKIEGYTNTSVQAHLLKGLSEANKFAGKTIEKVPVIGKTQLDENLITVGEKLSRFGEKRTEKTLSRFIEKQSSCVRPFIENIDTINKLYNQPMELYFDKDNLYLTSLGD